MSAEVTMPVARRRVLMLTPQLGYGGAETSFTRLANFLAKHHDVTVAMFARGYGAGGYVEEAGELICPSVILDQSKGSQFGRWRQRWRHFRCMKAENDLAISFLPGPNLLNALTGTRVPSVVSERGSKYVAVSKTSALLWRYALDPIVYRLAHAVVPASRGLGDEITRGRSATFAARVVPIEGTVQTLPLLTGADAAVEPAFEPFARYKTIVACGRLAPVKGIDHLVRAFAGIRREVADARLLLIGDGPDLALLEGLCRSNGLTSAVGDPANLAQTDVVFAGYRKDPIRYFRLGRVYVMPSLHEGLPNALIEALASGIPVFAGDSPGPRSVLAATSENLARVDRVTQARRLAHGTLMPRIDSDAGRQAWQTELAMALTQPMPRAPLEERRAAIARFDIETSGLRWLVLIARLTSAQSALLPHEITA